MIGCEQAFFAQPIKIQDLKGSDDCQIILKIHCVVCKGNVRQGCITMFLRALYIPALSGHQYPLVSIRQLRVEKLNRKHVKGN